MFVRALCLSSMVVAAYFSTTTLAWAEGLGLGETKQQLKLNYEVSVKDHGTGRVTVTFTLADEGRLKPINSIGALAPPSLPNR